VGWYLPSNGVKASKDGWSECVNAIEKGFWQEFKNNFVKIAFKGQCQGI